MPPIAGWFQYLLKYYMLVLFMITQFLFWIRDSKPAKIWTRISGTKAAMLTIELQHPIDKLTICYFL